MKNPVKQIIGQEASDLLGVATTSKTRDNGGGKPFFKNDSANFGGGRVKTFLYCCR